MSVTFDETCVLEVLVRWRENGWHEYRVKKELHGLMGFSESYVDELLFSLQRKGYVQSRWFLTKTGIEFTAPSSEE